VPDQTGEITSNRAHLGIVEVEIFDQIGQFMERKSSEGPFKGVAKEPAGRDGKD